MCSNSQVKSAYAARKESAHPDASSDGFPLAYEVMDGNTSGRTTLRGFLDQIEKTYGKAKRMWVGDLAGDAGSGTREFLFG
jgi:hypothetical protein